MINFEEELKKFQPVLELDEVEETVRERELTDLLGLLDARGKETGDDTEKDRT